MPRSNKKSTIDLQRKEVYSVQLCISKRSCPRTFGLLFDLYALLSQNTLLDSNILQATLHLNVSAISHTVKKVVGYKTQESFKAIEAEKIVILKIYLHGNYCFEMTNQIAINYTHSHLKEKKKKLYSF